MLFRERVHRLTVYTLFEDTSLGHTEEIIAAGKHAFYDKPAGDDYPRFERLVAMARERGLLIQLGYMFRKHDGFERIAEWARSGFLGHVFYIRGQMSVNVTENEVKAAPQTAGLFFDLGCHMIDQVVWILGRPERVTSFLRHDAFGNPEYADNTLGVFEYDDSMAIVDIAGRGFGQLSRRFEVNGTEGSVTMEPMEPADTLRLHLDEPKGGYPAGVSVIKLEARPRYVASLASFVKEIRGEKEPDRSLDHELLVQETFLRATGNIRDRLLT